MRSYELDISIINNKKLLGIAYNIILPFIIQTTILVSRFDHDYDTIFTVYYKCLRRHVTYLTMEKCVKDIFSHTLIKNLGFIQSYSKMT